MAEICSHINERQRRGDVTADEAQRVADSGCLDCEVEYQHMLADFEGDGAPPAQLEA